jgi:hypothetical protein
LSSGLGQAKLADAPDMGGIMQKLLRTVSEASFYANANNIPKSQFFGIKLCCVIITGILVFLY